MQANNFETVKKPPSFYNCMQTIEQMFSYSVNNQGTVSGEILS